MRHFDKKVSFDKIMERVNEKMKKLTNRSCEVKFYQMVKER